jgi:Glu-tRNA(Gln) amidotransferase subunit E-like FAD-binding protein
MSEEKKPLTLKVEDIKKMIKETVEETLKPLTNPEKHAIQQILDCPECRKLLKEEIIKTIEETKNEKREEKRGFIW